MSNCPICKSKLTGYREIPRNDRSFFDCPRCGKFFITRTLEVMLDARVNDMSDWRWKLSYWIRNNQTNSEDIILGSKQFKELPNEIKLPTLDQQADNLIKYLGSSLSNHAARITTISRYLASIIGAQMPSEVDYIADHLSGKGLLFFKKRNDAIEDGPMREFGLTFEGWKYYHSIIDVQSKNKFNSELPYDIAISFAGEDREIARQIAEGLRENGIGVFYDEFEKSTLWGKDLYEFLDDIYRNKAKYCIMILSKNYAHKAWPRHERKSAQARSLIENEEYILPIKLDDTEIPGIRETIGYISFDETTIPEIIELVKKKLE